MSVRRGVPLGWLASRQKSDGAHAIVSFLAARGTDDSGGRVLRLLSAVAR